MKVSSRDFKVRIQYSSAARASAQASVVAAFKQGFKGRTPALRTFYYLCKREGFFWTAVARKGVLSEEDRRARVRFAMEMRGKGEEFWKRVCFFLDCASFLYKRNPEEEAKTPRGKVWMRKGERIAMSGKCKNIGVGGRLLHLCVAIIRPRSGNLPCL